MASNERRPKDDGKVLEDDKQNQHGGLQTNVVDSPNHSGTSCPHQDESKFPPASQTSANVQDTTYAQICQRNVSPTSNDAAHHLVNVSNQNQNQNQGDTIDQQRTVSLDHSHTSDGHVDTKVSGVGTSPTNTNGQTTKAAESNDQLSTPPQPNQERPASITNQAVKDTLHDQGNGNTSVSDPLGVTVVKPESQVTHPSCPGQSEQFKKLHEGWEQKAKAMTEGHYTKLRQGQLAPSDSSTTAAIGEGGVQRNGQENWKTFENSSTESEDKTDTDDEEMPSKDTSDNALAVVFNVLAPNAKKVWIELHTGGKEFVVKLEKFSDDHWKSEKLKLSPELNVKYHYVMTPLLASVWKWWPSSSGNIHEQYQRSLSQGVNQYDVFHNPENRHYHQREFEGKLYYIDALYHLVSEESVKEFLMDCEYMGFDRHNLTVQERQQFLKWFHHCTQVQLNHHQALFLVVLLGRVANQVSFSSHNSISTEAADTILNLIQESHASTLPSNSGRYLEAAACVLISESSMPGALNLFANFCSLIEAPRLLNLAKEKCTNRCSWSEHKSVYLIDMFLKKLAQNKPSRESDQMMKFVICHATDVTILLHLYKQSHRLFHSTQERDSVCADAFRKHVESAVSTSGDQYVALVKNWSSLDQELRQSLSGMFISVIVKKLNGSLTWWSKERTQHLYDLLLKEEICSSKEMFQIVERLPKSENEDLCILFYQMLDSPKLTKWWSKLEREKQGKLCIAWLQTASKRRQFWRVSKLKVIEMFQDMERLCNTYQVDKDQIMKESLGKYLQQCMREIDLKDILNVFDEVDKLSEIAKKCYVQSIIDALQSKKEGVMSSIKDVLRIFGRQRQSANTKSTRLFVPRMRDQVVDYSRYVLAVIFSRLAEGIIYSVLDMTKPTITEDAAKENKEEVVKGLLDYRDLWLTFLGSEGHVNKLHQHPKLVRIRQALQWFAEAVSTRCVRTGFINDLLQVIEPTSTEAGKEDALSTALAALCSVACDADDKNASKWKAEIVEICKAKSLYERQLSRVEFLVRYCQSIASGVGLHISDQQAWFNTIGELKESLSSKSVEEVEKDDHWITLNKVSSSAEAVFQLKHSHVFYTVSQHCIRRETADEDNTLFLEDAERILSTKGVEEFQKVCNPLFDGSADITVQEANVFWKEFRDKQSLQHELLFIERFFNRGPVDRTTKEMLFSYQKLPNLQSKVQTTLKLLDAFGFKEDKELQFLQTLRVFMETSNSKSSTIKDLSAVMKSVTAVDKLFEDDHFKDIVDQLASSRDLIAFVREVANEDLRILIDAVEEHSDQSVSESTVSDLIELHQFLRGALKSKSVIPENLLKNLKKSFDDLTKKSGMAARIKSCSCNVHTLRGLYLNVANRGEVTKEIIANAVERGSYQVAVDPDGTPKVVMTYKRQDGNTAAYNLAELSDLRSRALLILNADRKPVNNPGMKPVDFGKFVEQVDTITEILQTASKLQSSGHLKFRSYRTTCDSIEKTRELERKLQKELIEWEETLKSVRNKYFFLKYFHSDQMWKIQEYFATGYQKENKDAMIREVHSLLRYIDPTVKIEEIESMRTWFKTPKSKDDLKANLHSLGDSLDGVFKSRNTAIMVHESKVSVASAKKIKETVKPGQLYVAVLEPNSTMTVNVVMSLFRNVTGGPPKPNQVLFCHAETTWEEVQLFLQRCFEAPTFGLSSELHCLANVENLGNEIQFDLVMEIRKFKAEFKQDNTQSFLLSLICCGGDRHHIVDQFSEFKHHVPGMTDVELKKCFALSFPNVSMVTSDLPGSGKTESIREDAAAISHGIVTVPISGPVSRQALVTRLSSLKLRAYESLHLDVGEVDDAQFLDMFLFQLVVVGMVSSGTTFYHLPTRHISIEIANTLQHWLRDSFPVCKCFNRVHLDQDVYKKFVVSKEITSSVQVVCHYLDAYECGSLENKDLVFSGSTQLKPLPHARCRHLLAKYFSATGDMSFTVLEIFLNVLADQLMKFSTSQYFRTYNLKVMLKGDHEVRTQLFRSLLEVSQEFAARSVLVCRTEQSEAVAKKQASEVLERMRSQVGNTAEQMVDRVKGMIQWADSNHLMVVFNSLDSHTISALYRKVGEVPKRVQDLFESQASGKKLEDIAKLTQKQLQEKLNRIVRSSPQPKNHDFLTSSYALTPDNVLKMSLIIQRVRANIPVIVMGETGCGKTSLIRYLAKTCEVPYHVFNFHAGILEEEIIKFIRELVDKTKKDGLARWVFLDEINTCEHLGLINDLICHRSLLGKPLPPNLVLMAACNPYRIRPSEHIETAGLSGKSTVDEYSKLVYRVHPLPETMIDYVWDYGSLDASDEQAYIARMVEALFDNQYQSLLVSLLTTSQAFIRQAEKSPYCVSLRDVNRCKLLIDWFHDILKTRPPLEPNKIENHLKKHLSITKKYEKKCRSIILSLAHCYQSRLPTAKTRREYREKMAAIFQEKGGMTMSSLKGSDFEAIVRMEQEDYLARMELPEGTAKNAALRENVFVILVCILNHIPIFVVGKPGCSKSLSMQVIRSNLRGRDSVDQFFKNLPQLYVVSHQGSESSTSQGIIKVFEKARKYKEKSEEGAVLPVVLLDEIGLAEISKYNPLKVLHSLLEPAEGEFPDVAVVGISNWSLDAAKMNRAIHLSRPEPDVDDLKETGLSIRHANTFNVNHMNTSLSSSSSMEDLPSSFIFPDDEQLECLANVYYEYQSKQKYANFHGLRDYYSLVKSLSIQRDVQFDAFVPEEISSRLIQRSLQRNFGGLRQEESNIQRVFMEKIPRCSVIQQQVATAELIAENLHDRLARHLMLITVADSAIGLLDQTLSELDKETITIFGSRFEEDLSDDYNYRILSRIILYMERDCVLILWDLENIYGSLYDMLNQNYTVVGGKKNCRVALGAYSNPMCQVHDGFRCIVLVDQQKVDYTDPPFLNRFEKQLLRFSDVITSGEKEVISTLRSWVEDVSTVSVLKAPFKVYDTFAGFHEDTLTSLVLHHRSKEILSQEELLERCKEDLLWVASPDGILRALKSKLAEERKSEVNHLCEEYFNKPIHSGIGNYMRYELEQDLDTDTADDLKLLVMTYSNVNTDVCKLLEGVVECQAEKLSSFKSEKYLTARIKSFWTDPEVEMLVLQCAPSLDAPHMLLMKSIVEQQRSEFLSSTGEEKRKMRKHVCILIHMQRENQEEEQLESWQFNFLSGWKQVMIDVLDVPSLSLTDLLGASLIDVLNSDGLAFKKIAMDQILWCFTCIKYCSGQRSLEDVLRLVQRISTSEEIFVTLKELVKQWINNLLTDEGVSLMEIARPWHISVACDRQALINSSTLVSAMQHHVTHLVRQPLAMIVFFLEKESAWPRCVTDGEIEDLDELNEWRNLLLDKDIFNIDEIAEPRGAEFYEVAGQRLLLKFPFSSVIKKKIEEVKTLFIEDVQQLQLDEENLNDDGELKVDAVRQQIERFSFIVKQKAPQLFQSEWLLKSTAAYVEDILDITSAELVPELTRVQRVQLLKSECASSMLESLERDALLLVTEIHCLLWAKTALIAAELELYKAGHLLPTVDFEVHFQNFVEKFDKVIQLKDEPFQKKQLADVKTDKTSDETVEEDDEGQKEKDMEQKEEDLEQKEEVLEQREENVEQNVEVGKQKEEDGGRQEEDKEEDRGQQQEDLEQKEEVEEQKEEDGELKEKSILQKKEDGEQNEGSGGKQEEDEAIIDVKQEEIEETKDENENENGYELLEQTVLELSSDSKAQTSDSCESHCEVKEKTDLESSGKDTEGFADEDKINDNIDQMATESKSQESFAEALIEASVTALLPTQPAVMAFGGVIQWQRSTNWILSLATRLFVGHPAVHFLRVCNDFASVVLVPEDLKPYSLYFLGHLGQKLAPEFLDSANCFEEVEEFVSGLEVSSSERIQHFLSLFYGRCIETNPDTQLLFDICQSICSNKDPEGVQYMGSVIHRVLLAEEIYTPGILNEILESPESLNDDHPALIDIDNCLVNDKREDSHFAVLCCDLLCEVAFQNVDTASITGSEDKEMKLFNKAVHVLCNEENRNGLRLICAVAFLRSFLQSLATTVLRDQSPAKLAMLLNEVNALLKSQAELSSTVNSRKASVIMYLLKEFRRQLSLYDLRLQCETSQMTCLHGLKWSESVSKYKTRQGYLCNTTKLSSCRDAMVRLMENQETEAMANLINAAADSVDGKLKLIALLNENFYHVRSLRSTKDTEDQAAKDIAKMVDACFSQPFSELVKQLLAQKDFRAPQLQLQPIMPSNEVQRAIFVVHLAALLVSNIKQSGSSALELYMLKLAMADETFVLGAPTSKDGYDVYLNVKDDTSPLHLCSCGTAFVCDDEASGNTSCPNCKSPSKRADKEKIQQSVTPAVKGYIAIDPKDLKSDTITARGLKPAVFRALHLLVHAALFGGSALGLVSDKELSTFLFKNKRHEEPRQYCFSHFCNDLMVLSQILVCSEERVLAWLHTVLRQTKHLFTATNVKNMQKSADHRNTLEIKFSEEIESLLNSVFRPCPSHQATCDAQPGVEYFIEMQIDEEDAVSPGQKDEGQSDESLRRLFRITIPKTFEHLKATFLNADEKQKSQYSIIGLFLDHSSQLSQLCHLNSLLKWHRVVDNLLSRRLSRQQAKSKCISEFVRGEYKGKDLAENMKTFEAFKKSWDKVRSLIAKYLRMQEEDVPRITEMSNIGYCLVEERDQGVYLAAALKALQEIQNEFLERVLNIAASGRCSALSSIQRGESKSAVGVVHLQDARERELIQYQWTDEILRHCQNNTEYGCGREIIYDFDKIEKELVARFLLGKTYLASDNGLRQFVFSQELFHACAGILNDLQQSILQEPLTSNIRGGILRLKESNLKNVQDLLEHLEVVVCLLKRTMGDPDQNLTVYTDKWLSMLPCPFPKSLLQECCDSIMLKHVVALYQALEDILSEAAVDSMPDTYREPLIDEAKKDLVKLAAVRVEKGELSPLDAMMTALRRFTYRYLSTDGFQPKPAECLSLCLVDPSLWPLGYVRSGKPPYVPETLIVGNIRPALDYLQELSKDLKKQSGWSKSAATRKGTGRLPATRRKVKGNKLFSYT